MHSDLQVHVLSDEELSPVTGGSLFQLQFNIGVVPQTAVANSMAVVLFSGSGTTGIASSLASTGLTLPQSNLGSTGFTLP
jgi:hypothetical protein